MTQIFLLLRKFIHVWKKIFLYSVKCFYGRNFFLSFHTQKKQITKTQKYYQELILSISFGQKKSLHFLLFYKLFFLNICLFLFFISECLTLSKFKIFYKRNFKNCDWLWDVITEENSSPIKCVWRFLCKKNIWRILIPYRVNELILFIFYDKKNIGHSWKIQ